MKRVPESPSPGLLRSVFESPRLSAALFLLWLLLNRSLDAGTLLGGAFLALLVPWLTRPLRPPTSPMRRPLVALRLLLVVLHDIVKSNLAVARGVLRRARPDGRFIVVPLELRDPAGLALLAIIVCLTPDTLWAEISLDRTRLLLHVFDLDDEAASIAEIKNRYEKPLLEMFAP